MTYPNGRIPAGALCEIPSGRLRCDAADAWNAMNDEAERVYGVTLRPGGPDSSYRSYDRQVYWKNWWCARGHCENAAEPGTSNHGKGIAVDDPTPTQREIIAKIGARYGYQKAWSDAPWEPWHYSWRAADYPAVRAYVLRERDPLRVLTSRERRLVEELLHLRRTSGAHGWTDERRARADSIKHWMRAQRGRIKALPRTDGRARRYVLLGRAIRGGNDPEDLS